MDIKTLLNNLHEEVSCSVCMNTFTDPKQLPCLHSFCLHCLQGIQRTSGRRDVITCPECRRESRVPGNGNLNELPTNFRINSLLDVLAIKECNTTGVKCGNCDKKSSKSFYCFQCCAFWCEENCITLHNGMKANKEHRVLALKEFQDKDFETVLKRPAFCQKKHHETEELKFFCKDCKVSICNACVVTLHEGHAKTTLKEAANERKLKVKSVIESQKQNVQQNRNRIEKIDETCIQIQERVATVKRDAQNFAEKMIDIIEAKKQEIINKADHQAAESIERLVIQKSEIEHQVNMTETVIEDTETLLKRSTSAEMVILDESLHPVFPEEVNYEREVDCDFEVLRQFSFVENVTLMNEINTEGIGSLKTSLYKTSANQSSAEGKGISEATVGLEAQFVLITRNAKGEQCYEERDCVTVEIRNQQGHDCATKARVQDNKDGTYKISYFAKETAKCDVSVKVNTENVRGSPFEVQVKLRQYRAVLSFGKEGSAAGMLNKPWGVAVNERNEIAVTDRNNNRIQIFSSDGTYLRFFGIKGDKQGEFNSPSGIVFDKNGNLLVVDRNNSRVQCFSEHGEHLNTFSSKGSLDHQLNCPLGLSVDNDGNIIVADSNYNKVIKIFYPKGQFLSKIGVEGCFTLPFHCVQCEQCLIISDSEDHCVKVFDKDGNFLYKFGKKGKRDGEFNAPHCLSVDKAGHLMVCDKMNHRVQVFELSGKFITKFGTFGNGIGELNCPVSAGVLSDGKIVVTNFSSNRIQIFE